MLPEVWLRVVGQAEVGKPPYRVPSMGEIRAIEPCGLVAASTFSGCGGSSLGYRMAGFSVRYANEFVEAARDTYAANQSSATFLDGRDIRTVTGAEILEYCGGSVDLLDGSPPCSDFSTAGKREEGWGKIKTYSDTEQRVDDLFFEFVRLIREVQPRCFVAENVSGLVKGSAKGYFKRILAEMRASGYRVNAKVLNASWLGVPQSRERLIFVGVRDDQPFEPIHPRPLPFQYTIRDATADIAECGMTDPETGMRISIEDYAIHSSWKNLKPGKSPAGKHYTLTRCSPDRPAPTITATGGNVGSASTCHGEVPRKFSLLELRRLCSFPDDFALTGTYVRRWERLGRAVPPVMMSHITAGLRDALLADRSLTHV